MPTVTANVAQAIKALPGHENDQVIVGGVAPWNPQTHLRGQPERRLGQIPPGHPDHTWGRGNCDGIAIHAYTHGSDPKLIYTDALMNPPFQNRQYNFRTYQDFMSAIPRSMRTLPVYLTETDQDDAWRNENTGWVQRAYGEIDWWNKQPGNQVIRAVILYRWPNVDKWGIDGKAGVIDDFRQALLREVQLGGRAPGQTGGLLQPYRSSSRQQPSVEANETIGRQPTQVRQPVVDTSPIRFDPTGKTAKGLFAAFYRQYGLDITGYPITEEYIQHRQRAEDPGLAAPEHGGIPGHGAAAPGRPGGDCSAEQVATCKAKSTGWNGRSPSLPSGGRRAGRADDHGHHGATAARPGWLRHPPGERHPVHRHQPHRRAARSGRGSRGAGTTRASGPASSASTSSPASGSHSADQPRRRRSSRAIRTGSSTASTSTSRASSMTQCRPTRRWTRWHSSARGC